MYEIFEKNFKFAIFEGNIYAKDIGFFVKALLSIALQLWPLVLCEVPDALFKEVAFT